MNRQARIKTDTHVTGTFKLFFFLFLDMVLEWMKKSVHKKKEE
jgi:hypothetical protein